MRGQLKTIFSYYRKYVAQLNRLHNTHMYSNLLNPPPSDMYYENGQTQTAKSGDIRNG